MGRKLGQHFLINKRKIKNIIDALELKDSDTVVEIGPGRGELTKEIFKRGKKIRVIAIEKDPELAQKLSEQLQMTIHRPADKFQISKTSKALINGDALKVLPYLVTNYGLRVTNYKLIGNIPFYITGRLLRILGELGRKPSLIVLTIQKEVARRLAAQPPRMNLLAATVQFWAKPEILEIVPKTDFKPQPKVDGAVVKLIISDRKLRVEDEENYYKLVKTLFKQPRKTILNNLLLQKTAGIQKENIITILEEVGIDPNARPQQLSLEVLRQLSCIFLINTPQK